MTRVVVLISGRGSNLQALLDAEAGCSYRIVGVISNRPDAAGLARARARDIGTRVIDDRACPDRACFERALAEAIEAFSPDLLALAGFMRILSEAFVRRFAGRMINIHPSLLPAHRGLDTHRRVLQAGDAEHGASIHYVTAELDGGPVIARSRLSVHPGDTPDGLADRVLTREHHLYPAIIELIALGRIEWRDAQIYYNGQPLDSPLEIDL